MRRWYATDDVLTPEMSAEQRLAVAVLSHALDSDAGRAWLQSDPWAAWWCRVAGLDPAAVRERLGERRADAR